jgi:hypothetical protein
MSVKSSSNRLDLIKGIVSELQVRQAEEHFVFTNADKTAGGMAAAGLAIDGLAGAATGALLSSGDTADKVYKFACKVGDQIVIGQFGEVTFANGDEVEVACEVRGSYMSAYAITRPSSRTIWMHPHCGRGRRAYILHSIRWIAPVSYGAPFFLALLDFFLSSPSKGLLFLFLMPLFVGLIVATVFSFVAAKFKKFSLLSSEIFAALRFDNPEEVDLPKLQNTTLKNATNEERLAYHPHARWVYKY